MGLGDTRHIGRIVVHPQRSRSRLCRGARPRLGHEQAARHLPLAGRRPPLAARPVQERARRLARHRDRPAQSRRPLRADLAGAALSARVDQRRRGMRTVALARRRRHLDRHHAQRPACPRACSARSASPCRRCRWAAAAGGRVWALIEAEDGALFRSDDGGSSWERASEFSGLRTRPWYYMHVTADPCDPDTVYVQNYRLWKSIDAGRTFLQVPTGHGDDHALWIDPRNPQRMIEGNDGGACVSFNGGQSWSSIYNQPTAQLYHVTTDNRFPYRVYASQQDNTAISIPELLADRRDHRARLDQARRRRERLHRDQARRSTTMSWPRARSAGASPTTSCTCTTTRRSRTGRTRSGPSCTAGAWAPRRSSIASTGRSRSTTAATIRTCCGSPRSTCTARRTTARAGRC